MKTFTALLLGVVTIANASQLRATKCATWCEKSFDANPDHKAVCDYMRREKVKACLECSPCKEETAVAAATMVADDSWITTPKCKKWCKNSFKNKDPDKMCAYMRQENLPCTGCSPCVEAGAATKAEAKAVAEAKAAQAKAKATKEEADALWESSAVATAFKAAAEAEAEAETKVAAAAKAKADAEEKAAAAAKAKAIIDAATKPATTKAEQLATNENIIKAAADSEMTPLEYAQKVAHLNPTQQSVVALAAAKHAKAKEQKNKAKASHINGIKEMAEEMLKKNNISKEKAAMVAMVGAQEKLKANCFKHGLCVKKGTGELTDEEAMSSYGTLLGVKKVISTECDACPEANSGGCVDDSTNYEEYLVYLKCKENAKNVDLLD